MLFLPKDDLFTNRFVETKLPTKEQIFSRTGQRAVSPSGSYSWDDAVRIGSSTTQQAEAFAESAEAFESKESNDDLPED